MHTQLINCSLISTTAKTNVIEIEFVMCTLHDLYDGRNMHLHFDCAREIILHLNR